MVILVTLCIAQWAGTSGSNGMGVMYIVLVCAQWYCYCDVAFCILLVCITGEMVVGPQVCYVSPLFTGRR